MDIKHIFEDSRIMMLEEEIARRCAHSWHTSFVVLHPKQ